MFTEAGTELSFREKVVDTTTNVVYNARKHTAVALAAAVAAAPFTPATEAFAASQRYDSAKTVAAKVEQRAGSPVAAHAPARVETVAANHRITGTSTKPAAVRVEQTAKPPAAAAAPDRAEAVTAFQRSTNTSTKPAASRVEAAARRTNTLEHKKRPRHRRHSTAGNKHRIRWYYRGVNYYDLFATSGYPNGEGPINAPFWNYRFIAKQGNRAVRLAFACGPKTPNSMGLFKDINGTRNPEYLDRLITEVNTAGAAGLKVILDSHCSGRWPHSWSPTIQSEIQFSNAWRNISMIFKNNRFVYAYDLANEPHNLKGENTLQNDRKVILMERAAIKAIRENGDNKMIIVSANDFNSIDWTTGRRPWIKRQWSKGVAFSASLYPAKTYDNVDTFTREDKIKVRQQANKISNWCIRYKKKCVISEIGWTTAAFNRTMDQVYK